MSRPSARNRHIPPRLQRRKATLGGYLETYSQSMTLPLHRLTRFPYPFVHLTRKNRATEATPVAARGSFSLATRSRSRPER